MISGTTIGRMRRLVIAVRKGMCGRVNPTAARVPSVVAISVAHGAIMKLFFTAFSHTGSVKKLLYHCHE